MELINILKKQAEVYKAKLAERLASAKTEADVFAEHSTVFKEFYEHAFRPTSDGEAIRELTSDKMNDTALKNATDLSIAYSELNNISSKIANSYNSNQDFRTSLKNRIEQMSNIVSDANMILSDDTTGSVMFKDSLSNYTFIDKDFSGGTKANIATSEGVAFLSVANEKNLSTTAREVKISGNGEAGNAYVVKKVDVQTFNSDYDIYAQYKSEQDAHNNPATITDGQASTWFEYQKLGIPATDAERYYVTWPSADKIKDELLLRISIELANLEDVNWIDITPYIPEGSKSNLVLYSAKISQDGSNYSPVYKDAEILNREINIVPQRYTQQELFRDDGISKLAAQGILSFPTAKAKFIEIILKQNKPYDELIGATYYDRATIVNGVEIARATVRPQTVPPSIVDGPIGKYKVDKNDFIIKNIAVLNGWRYLIGIRGIDAYSRVFEEQSEIITKKFSTDNPMKEIMLYANEIIPDAFLAQGLEKRNDWIKYYISINDSDWYQISPMHHNQVGELAISPKVYEINSMKSSEERLAAKDRGYLTSDGNVTSVRLKIVFSRPATLTTYTPILEEYALRCMVDGGI